MDSTGDSGEVPEGNGESAIGIKRAGNVCYDMAMILDELLVL